MTDHTIALKYTGINGVEHFIIDITVMVLSALVRNDLRIIYELSLIHILIVQIGNKDDTGVGSSAAEVATWVLKDYVKMFQLRNPQLYVIGVYIHLDEETPHLHLNFVPWVSGCKRGLETKTSLKAALATRGFASEGKRNTEWKQWAEAEKDDIALIMRLSLIHIFP